MLPTHRATQESSNDFLARSKKHLHLLRPVTFLRPRLEPDALSIFHSSRSSCLRTPENAAGPGTLVYKDDIFAIF